MNKKHFQIIFVVETTRKARTDCRYIKEILNHFFQEYFKSSLITFQFVYMNGKHSWNCSRVAREIHSHIISVPEHKTFVLYCVDMDNFVTNPTDERLIQSIIEYCDNEAGNHCILFNKNIENVLIGKSIKDSLKVKTVDNFIRKGLIKNVPEHTLRNRNPLSEKCSNVLCILEDVFNLTQIT